MTDDVDLDRLADYISGALDGTPDEAAVARLVATDPDWTRAHAALVAAEAFVRADLAVLADEPEPMPADVMARLDAAFTAEPPLSQPSSSEADAATSEDDTAPARPHLSVLPGGLTAPAPSPRRRPWRPVAAVAAGLVVVGLGVSALAPRLGQTQDTSGLTSSSAGGAAAKVPPSAGQVGSPGLRASGLDYDATTLAALGSAPLVAKDAGPARSEAGPNAMGAAPSAAAGSPANIPAPLHRLAEADARTACLQAILALYGGTTTLVDYARFQGSPALVVLLDGARGVTGQKWVVVVGPECGSGGVIADQRYSAQVG